MGFFMFLTGVVMFYTYPEMHGFNDYAAYVKKKFIRLMPAYFLYAVVVAVGKTVVGTFASIENPVNGLDGLVRVFVCPMDSYCRSVWYVYTIFIFFVIVPILLKVFRQNLAILLVLALVLYCLPRVPWFALDQVCKHMFAFLLGGLAVRHYDAYVKMLDRYAWLFLSLFAVCVLSYFVVRVPKLLFVLCSIPAVHALVRIRSFQQQSVLDTLAKYTFPIYLMNTMAIGLIRVLVQKYWSWDGTNFLIVAPVLFVAGILIPILCHRLFIRNTPILQTIVQA
jgi:peptidoglycan/LPS O-acetylase OafA/YrhL